ncbi:hypothetical protein M3M35_03220 [Fructilactobacillus myrtifloralis]|uniref:Glycosyl-4,4'-diaponeurosporenoate acyltransferase n=1 Tax=Fructilactobacillus myrtifloralis TaxID=2940301 RepID=A0ABY5BRI7_9LACO|nr:hypothetical protein [Fructilactobacillus myrtifloralis]USS85657.1 hypothetical protein M3M35_03220 [Fructilactobacillus myrtifloralis]
MNNLKDYKHKDVQYFIFANAIIIILFSTKFSSNSLSKNYQLYKIIVGLFSTFGNLGIIYIYSIILDDMIPTKFKNLLVFGKETKLPGNNIFTKLFSGNYKDYRVSSKNMQNFYKKIGKKINNRSDPMIENHEWYKIYSKVKNEDIVFFSNSDYLLARDLTVVSIIFCILYCLFPLLPFVFYNYKVHIFLFCMFILTRCITLILGYKFTNNVLVENYIRKRNDK